MPKITYNNNLYKIGESLIKFQSRITKSLSKFGTQFTQPIKLKIHVTKLLLHD